MFNINGSVSFYTLYFLLLAVIIVLYRYGHFNKKYVVWRSAYRDYNRYQKEYLEDGSWCSFIEYYKSLHNVVAGSNVYHLNKNIAHFTECVKLLSTSETTIKEYFQQNKFRFNKEYAKMIAEIRVAKKVSSETDVVIEEVLLSNDVASENISATTDGKEDTIDCNKSKKIDTKPVDQVQMKLPTLIDLLIIDDEYKKDLLNNIKKYIADSTHSGKANGLLMRVLKDLKYIDKNVAPREFYRYINSYFGVELKGERGAYNYHLIKESERDEDYYSILRKIKINEHQQSSIC